MWPLIPLPYRILIVLAVLTAIFGAGTATGYKVHKARTDAAALEELEAERDTRKQMELAYNHVSGQLLDRVSEINANALEVSKNVRSVTTGRPCLGADAVRVLSAGGAGLRSPADTGKPDPEIPARFATDTDVGDWANDARRRYRECAETHAALVDLTQQPIDAPKE